MSTSLTRAEVAGFAGSVRFLDLFDERDAALAELESSRKFADTECTARMEAQAEAAGLRAEVERLKARLALALVATLPREATGPARHILKTWPEPFKALADGRKTFEFRNDDRGFEVGDMLVLRQFVPRTEVGDHTIVGHFVAQSPEVIRWVTYILRGPAFGVPDGYCVMSMSEQRPKP